ncbi:MAG: phosphoribosylaminoimidazolesuccinocarboxamide synthase, partial [Myxococcota bacterium]
MSDEIIYEGKAKQLIPTGDDEVVIQRFKDEATAFNGVKFAVFPGKGIINNAISCHWFEELAGIGVPTHYREKLNGRDMEIDRLTIIPLEVVVRNIAAGSLAKRLGWEEGTKLPRPIVETYYKKDELGDPLLAPVHIDILGLVEPGQWAQMEAMALSVNEVLVEGYQAVGIDVVDFKLEFGTRADGMIVLGDEISPDTSRLWDAETQQKFDKDVFRRD